MSAMSEDVTITEINEYVTASDGCRLHIQINDFSDPWTKTETVLLIHGLAESGHAWFGWVPTLSRKMRVVRADIRGYGQSTPMERDYPWSLDVLADDIAAIIEHLGDGPVHIVGARIGGTIGVRAAAKRPDLVKTLTVIGLPVKGMTKRPGVDPEVHGVRAWARSSQEERMGPQVPEAMLDWWSDLMAVTPLSTLLGFSTAVAGFDVGQDLPKLTCPMLAITSDSKRHPLAETEAWSKRVKSSEILIVPGEGFHAAAVFPDMCSAATLQFIEKHVS